jgi:DNA repair exonuclease SbcCD ATPase subunit
MTYRELADFLGVEEESARRRAQRARWPRRPGNDGKARVGVPGDVAPDETRKVTRDDQGDDGGDITPALAALMERQAAELAKLHERVGRAEGEAKALQEALQAAEALAIEQRERAAAAEGEAVALRDAVGYARAQAATERAARDRAQKDLSAQEAREAVLQAQLDAVRKEANQAAEVDAAVRRELEHLRTRQETVQKLGFLGRLAWAIRGDRSER